MQLNCASDLTPRHIVFLARLCFNDINRRPSSFNIIAQTAEYDSFHKEIGQGGVHLQDRTGEEGWDKFPANLAESEQGRSRKL